MADTRALAKFYRRNAWAFPLTLLLIAGVIGYFIWQGSRPAQGSWRYGLCRTFIEFEYAYPITFDVMGVSEERSGARIFFAEKNPFGNERIVQADCDYQVNGDRITLVRLSLDRKPVSKTKISFYNRLIPTLMMQKLNVDLPPALPRSLDQLKR